VPLTGGPFAWRTVPGRPGWPGARGCARSPGSKLELRWSPEQIAGWLKASHPDDPEMRVSHETIYLSLFVQSRGALRKELARYLRSGRARRRPRGLSVMNGQGQLRGTVHISQRPAEANDRAVPGHWEGDLVFGKRSSTVATLVERKSRFAMLVRLPGSHTADVVADALAEAIATLPEQLRRSITWDQGKEMAEHARFSVATGVPVYFCDPRSPWQGSNENTNGLPRQYFPRSTDFRALTQSDFDNVAAELNGRPRQTLGWKSPCQAPAPPEAKPSSARHRQSASHPGPGVQIGGSRAARSYDR
jgi:IS30 family transposase